MEKLGIKVKDQEVVEANGKYQLKESVISYMPISTSENGNKGTKNVYFGMISLEHQ